MDEIVSAMNQPFFKWDSIQNEYNDGWTWIVWFQQFINLWLDGIREKTEVKKAYCLDGFILLLLRSGTVYYNSYHLPANLLSSISVYIHLT